MLLPLPDMETDATRTRIDAAICRALRLPAIDSIRASYSDRNTHNSGHTTTDGSVTSNSPPTIDAHQPRQHLCLGCGTRLPFRVVYPERGAMHDAFWSHFYLTDDFAYERSFGKKLPQQCRSIH